MHSLCTFCRFLPGRGARAALHATWVAVLLSAVSGCHSMPQAMPQRTVEQALLPAPEFNPDLVTSLLPSNDRDWSADQTVLAYAHFDGPKVTIHNIRNCRYRSVNDYDVAHYDKTLDLGELTSLDFIVVPFLDTPGIAHTMLSFGFAERDYVVVSVEIRKELGEKYSPISGFLQQYELMYVVADERDILQLNAIHHLADVYVHRARATPEQLQSLFVDVIRRVNKLYEAPEFYHTIANNCTTNIRDHINRLRPNRVPYDYRVLLPGYSDKLAYDLGLLETDTTFEQTRAANRINYRAYVYRDDPTFSTKIRR